MYADIIIDISHEKLDRAYQYAVPKEWEDKAVIGARVMISFGRADRVITGYIIGISEQPCYDTSKIKPIKKVLMDNLIIESKLIQLADWMRETYGATMNDALKMVLPVKKEIRLAEEKYLSLNLPKEKAETELNIARQKHYKAKERLLCALIEKPFISMKFVHTQLSISAQTIRSMEQQGMISVITKELIRNPVKEYNIRPQYLLNHEQMEIASDITAEYNQGIRRPWLIHGITGSGKTEIYMAVIETVLSAGKQVILLIPEIALTYQTVRRFTGRFGSRVSILNSRMSAGERYDQYIRAKKQEVSVMIGPRSALFTPFPNLGLIIIDEEHEGSYKSEMPPKFHTRDTAIKRAELDGAGVILGSATPSLEAYKNAKEGNYKLYTLTRRAGFGSIPKIYTVDLREELKQQNRSIFSHQLKNLIEQRLDNKEQIILFINRRGYAGFISCRSCGYVMKCPHCDVSLTYHNNGRLLCHYCGFEQTSPKQCPSCQSKYIAAFGTGTQKVEELTQKEFPDARILRMDADTTGGKEGHEKILKAFAEHKADILVGTQMIVKGHDFPSVTLVGIIAADLSLYANDFRAAERTFQLLVQAAGRAGRGEKKGEVVIQTYNPGHYAIQAAANNDYARFYEEEMSYRNLLSYPPASHLFVLFVTAQAEEKAVLCAKLLAKAIREYENGERISKDMRSTIVGPAKATIAKLNDRFRQVVYVKHGDMTLLRRIKYFLDGYMKASGQFTQVMVQFDFDPMMTY